MPPPLWQWCHYHYDTDAIFTVALLPLTLWHWCHEHCGIDATTTVTLLPPPLRHWCHLHYGINTTSAALMPPPPLWHCCHLQCGTHATTIVALMPPRWHLFYSSVMDFFVSYLVQINRLNLLHIINMGWGCVALPGELSLCMAVSRLCSLSSGGFSSVYVTAQEQRKSVLCAILLKLRLAGKDAGSK